MLRNDFPNTRACLYHCIKRNIERAGALLNDFPNTSRNKSMPLPLQKTEFHAYKRVFVSFYAYIMAFVTLHKTKFVESSPLQAENFKGFLSQS